jgi:membrane protein YqaA with SNARE-associated domain
LPADRISVWPWFAFYAAFFLSCVTGLAMLGEAQGWSWPHLAGAGSWSAWKDWAHQLAQSFAQTSPAFKLLGFTVYLSLCCTVLPLPTGWIVAAVATREAAITGELGSTVALVALTGAIGSTIANLNDYHLFTLLLRHRGIARLRDMKNYQRAARWFDRSPFFILTLFSLLPIPVDVVRLLAISCRYGRPPFAAANLLGRFVRYAIIAFVTYYWNLGWVAVVALLAFAALMGVLRLGTHAVKKLTRGKAAGQA